MFSPRTTLLLLIAGLVLLWRALDPLNLVSPAKQGPAASSISAPFREAFVEQHADQLPDRALARLHLPKGIRLTPDPGYWSLPDLEFSPDGRLLIVGSVEGLLIWDVPGRRLSRFLPKISKARFSPDGKVLATSHDEEWHTGEKRIPSQTVLTLWDIATWQKIRRYPVDLIRHFSFSDDGQTAYIGNEPIVAFDLATGTSTPLYDRASVNKGLAPHDRYTSTDDVEFSSRNYVAASTTNQGDAYVYRCRSSRSIDLLKVKMGNDPKVRLSPDGTMLATLGGGPLRLFDTQTAELFPVPKNLGSVDVLAFSPDSRRIAWADSHQHYLRYWEIGTAKPGPALEDAFANFAKVAFSADGRLLASFMTDQTILLWDLTAEPASYNVAEKLREQRRAQAVTKTSIVVEKDKYFVGETIDINHVITNVGPVEVHYVKGGDYRGADRHLRYYIKATHEDGEEMADPNPNQWCMGGLAQVITLASGMKDTKSLELLAYRRLDRPGKYWITAGSGSDGCWIELVMPTLEQARKLVDDLDAANPPPKIEREEPHKIWQYHRLNHPLYLPIMTERARAGSYSALLALGEMADPRATQLLIELLDHADAKFVYAVQEALYLRMPDPMLDGKLKKRNFFDADSVGPRTWLRDKSWRPEFAVAVRRHARACLAKRDEASLFRGAFMLSCLGTAEDLPDFVAAFTFAVKGAQGAKVEEGRYPRAPGACGELRRATQMLIASGVPVDSKPATSGAKLLFVEKIKHDPAYRPPGWEATFQAVLKDEMDYVREVAVSCLPDPTAEAFRGLVRERIVDPNPDVQIAALHHVHVNAPPEWKPAVLRVFGTAEEFWLRNAAEQAAHHLCSPLEYVELTVGLIEKPALAKSAVESLTCILRDAGSKNLGTDVDTPQKRQKCQSVWRDFVAANRERIERKDRFSIKEAIPLDDLFPGISFHGRE